MAEKRTRSKHRFWRLCRLYFRRFRILVWSMVLLFLGGILYLNQVGLPDFITDPLLEKLRAQGIDLKFTRLRFRWVEGIVAENVRFGHPEDPNGPYLTVKQVRVHLNDRALIRRRLQVESLWLRDGELVWPVGETNDAPRQIRLENIESQLRFLPNDRWALDDFTGIFAGANFRVSGAVTNASHIREWTFLQQKELKAGKTSGLERRVRYIADALERIHFSAPPELKLDIRGDAHDLLSFKARLSINAEGAETPWGTVFDGRFSVLMFPSSNGVSRAELSLQAAQSQTPWTSISNLQLKAVLVSSEGRSNMVSGSLQLCAGHAQTKWCSGSNLVITSEWMHSVTNPVPLSGRARIKGQNIESQWGSAGRCELEGKFRNLVEVAIPGPVDPSLGWWTNIARYGLQLCGDVQDLAWRGIQVERVSVASHWERPNLMLSNLTARLYDAELKGQGSVNIESRVACASVETDLDPNRTFPLLTEGAKRWLSQFTWDDPPKIRGELSLVLPAWTNRQTDWRVEVLPQLRLAGEFKMESPGAYRGISAISAASHFNYSNQCWHLPDLTIIRPEGRILAEYNEDGRTKDFYAKVDSTVDPLAIRPVLKPKDKASFNLISLVGPPRIKGEIWGRHRQPELLGFRGRVELTNFSFREQWASKLETDVEFTNKVVRCFQPRISRYDEHAGAEGLAADFNEEKVFLTNAVSTFDPMVIARAIGPQVARAIEAYHFEKPPKAHVHGIIPMRGEEDADLHFDLEGERFHWWKFNLARMAGHVHWAGYKVALRDIRAGFYEGAVTGVADFDFSRRQGTDFQFTAFVTNGLLQYLLADLSSGTNPPEGLLNGWVTVTRGNSLDWRTVDGYGRAELQDGLIWDIPLFGKLSPVLNGVSPGLGNSRATAGTCTFTITNGIVQSDDLQFQCQGTRVQYRGTVDLEAKLDARVEAELLRNMWLVGPLVSTVFWPVTKMFEYKLTGSLSDPQLEPIYIFPKLMLMPFHPVRTFKNFFPEDDSNRTNLAPLLPDMPR